MCLRRTPLTLCEGQITIRLNQRQGKEAIAVIHVINDKGNKRGQRETGRFI